MLNFSKKFFFAISLAFAFLFSQKTYAQLEVTQEAVQDLVQNVLLGQGVTATNITFRGNVSQFGSFNGANSNIGLNRGVIMATGGITVALGPNNNAGASVATGGSETGDPDLAAVAGATNANIRDVAIIEFDFIPVGDTISFRYVFGSEEYPEYVCSQFNDVFAFFLSGPGINGPFSLGAQNIALVPNTNIPVAINTVNPGVPGTSGNPGGCPPGGLNNAQFYVNNNGGQTVQFDGFTRPLIAKSAVQCGQTYHIKIAIADVFDAVFDSGVFLEAESFISAGIQINIVGALADSSIIEGCTTAEIVFTRPDTTESQTVFFNISGTAINGVDYTFIPDSVVFQPGQSTVSILINPTADNEFESEPESIIIEIFNITACGDTIVEQAVLFIKEDYEIILTSQDVELLCPSETISISSVASGGVPPYTYNWNTSQTGSSIEVTGAESGTYIVTVSDFCNLFTVQDTITVTLNTPPPLTLLTSNDTIVNCPGDFVTLEAVAVAGTPPYNFFWSNGSTAESITVEIQTNTFFTITLTDACQFPILTDTIFVNLINGPLVAPAIDTTVFCPGDEITLIGQASGGFPPYQYSWSTSEETESITIVVDENTTISYTVTDGCESVQNGQFNIAVPVYEPVLVTLDRDTLTVCRNSPIALNARAEGGTGEYTFVWGGAGTLQVINDTTLTVTPPSSGVYFVIATDQCQVSDTVSAEVNVQNCEIQVFNVFTPDGDGINDFWVIPNIEFYPNNSVVIFNRWGRKVFEAEPYQNNWDGGNNPSGVYFYVVDTKDDTEPKKGTVTIIRNKQ
ncbi:MAG: choice-of-anchor L domain-containing protein [Flavobacteriales bacterium]